MGRLLSTILLAAAAGGLALGALLSTAGESLLDPEAFGACGQARQGGRFHGAGDPRRGGVCLIA